MTEPYSTIREMLGELIGHTVVDITQHDQDEWERDGASYFMLMFEDGQTLKIFQSDSPAFILNDGEEEEEDDEGHD